MTNCERKLLIENAMRDYRAAKSSGDREKIAHAINCMENAFCCVSRFGVEGAETLRQMIFAAR